MVMELLTASDSVVESAAGLLCKTVIQALSAHKLPPQVFVLTGVEDKVVISHRNDMSWKKLSNLSLVSVLWKKTWMM